jgi:hypothetical protein
MTTGESLVSIWRDNITLEQEKAAAINAAIAEATEAVAKCTAAATTILMEEKLAEAVSKRTVECAGICLTKHFASDAGRDILALNAPPAPAYPFGYGYEGKLCECWHICNGHYECWTTNGTAVFNIHQQACQWCGAPRTKGS